MRALRPLAVIVLVLAASSVGAQQPPAQPGYEVTGITPRLKLDHYDPNRLRDFALDKARAGETTAAWILLERAALLAPHDVSVQQALASVRAARKGEPSTGTVPKGAVGRVPTPEGTVPIEGTAPVPPEPPPLWPPKAP